MGHGLHVRRLLAVVFALTVCGCATERHETVPQGPTAGPDPNFTCTATEAQFVAFAELRNRQDRYADRCVRTAVFTDGTNFAGNAAELRARSSSAEAEITFRFDSQRASAQPPRHPSFVSVVGRLRVCPTAGQEPPRASAPPCTAGLFVSEIHLLPTAMD
jgi:hypothetical protein